MKTEATAKDKLIGQGSLGDGVTVALYVSALLLSWTAIEAPSRFFGVNLTSEECRRHEI